MSESIEKLLKQAVGAADLRREETSRLIGAAKVVAGRICDAARESGLSSIWIRQWEEDEDVGLQILENPGQIKGLVLAVYESPDEEEFAPEFFRTRYIIAADSKAYDFGSFLLPKGSPYGEEGEIIRLYGGNPPCFWKQRKRVEITKEEAKKIKSLPSPPKLDTMPRRLWVKIAPMLSDLAQELAQKAQERTQETTAAADLAEKLVAAINA